MSFVLRECFLDASQSKLKLHLLLSCLEHITISISVMLCGIYDDLPLPGLTLLTFLSDDWSFCSSGCNGIDFYPAADELQTLFVRRITLAASG